MDISNYFPVWDQLTEKEQTNLSASCSSRSISKGTILHSGSGDCIGLLVVRTGRLRAFLSSEDGREVTLYRLYPRDICLFSASCIMQNIQFDIFIEAEQDTDLWVIPSGTYKKIMDGSAVLANYTNQIMASRFSEVMWLIEQIMWKSMDRRLASFLLEESSAEDSPVLKITHEKIAAHLGTAREVVTRMLRYFQREGYVRLSRGTVEITDPAALEVLDA